MDLTDKKYKLKQAKSHKGRLVIDSKLPKLVEDPKKAMFLNTENSSEMTRIALLELYLSRKTFSVRLNQKNKIESALVNGNSIEYFSEKNDTSLFAYTSDTKKKPMNLCLGNLFNNKLLDVFEFEITNMIPREYFDDKPEFDFNCQPVLVFQGEEFETNTEMSRLKIFFLDFYAQDLLEEVSITDLKKVIVFSSYVNNDNKYVKIRTFYASTINEYQTNDFGLKEIGPSFDLSLRQSKISTEDEFKLACKQPKLISSEYTKNRINGLFDVTGKLYISKQNLEAASLKRYDKLLSKKRRKNKEVNGETSDNNDENLDKNQTEEKDEENDDEFEIKKSKNIKTKTHKNDDIKLREKKNNNKGKNKSHKESL